MKTKDLEPIVLNFEELEEVKNKICTSFDKFNSERQSQLSHIKRVKEAIYGACDPYLGTKLNLPDAWEQSSTLKANLLESISSHPEGLFDVAEMDNTTSEKANLHKIFLCDALNKMKFCEKTEEIVNELTECGEVTLFVGWETRYRTRREALGLFENIQSAAKTPFMTIKEKIYEGASVKIVGAQDFVFDTKRMNRWESCPKIQRSYMEINEIFENEENFILTQAQKEELKLKLDKSKKETDITGVSEGLIEVLKFWGDIRLDNGKMLKNRMVVVVGRSAIVQNEINPYINCPYIYASLIQDPKTKRGMSPLAPILAMLNATDDIMQTQILGHKLVSNPPFLAPRGAFQGQIDVKPGKIIEYDPTLLPQMPQPLNFSQMFTGWDFIKYFKSQIERATGIFDNSVGQIKQENRTATEVSLSATGQNTRLNWFLDSINRKVIIPLIEKIAATYANFTIGKNSLVTEIEGKRVCVEITPEVREGNFIYRYSDRKSSSQRVLRQKEIENVISQFAKIESIAQKINWEECFKYSLCALGVENTSKFLKDEAKIQAQNENLAQAEAQNEIQTP